MQKVRGKFRVTEIVLSSWNKGGGAVKLAAVYSGSPEDNTYSAATPSGSIEMVVSNPEAFNALGLDMAFYVDFTPVVE